MVQQSLFGILNYRPLKIQCHFQSRKCHAQVNLPLTKPTISQVCWDLLGGILTPSKTWWCEYLYRIIATESH
jgi:hypothetical protein